MPCPSSAPSNLQIYGYGSIAVIVISLASLVGALIVPWIQKRVYQYSMLFFMALAVGTLAGDATLHLIPMSLGLDVDNVDEDCVNASANATSKDDSGKLSSGSYLWKMSLVLLTIHFLFIFESLANVFGVKHTHDHGHHNSETDLGEKNKTSEKEQHHAIVVGITPNASTTALVVKDIENEDLHVALEKISILPELGKSNDEESERSINFETGRDDTNTVTSPLLQSHSRSDFEFVRRRSSVGKRPSPVKIADIHAAAKARELTVLNEAAWKPEKPKEAENGKKDDDDSKEGSKFTFGLKPIAFMILLADAVHNFADGMAIGAAFGGSLSAGLSTTIAVFVHELPHELGDFAVLISSGLSVKSTLLLSMVSSVTALIGLYGGVGIATVPDAGQWVFAVVAGVFFYVALVDLVQEIKHAGKGVPRGWSFVLQNFGIFLGYAIMFLIAVFEDAIKV